MALADSGLNRLRQGGTIAEVGGILARKVGKMLLSCGKVSNPFSVEWIHPVNMPGLAPFLVHICVSKAVSQRDTH